MLEARHASTSRQEGGELPESACGLQALVTLTPPGSHWQVRSLAWGPQPSPCVMPDASESRLTSRHAPARASSAARSVKWAVGIAADTGPRRKGLG